MRIALISPLFESVPPRFYGGTERVVYWLAEALHDLGHDVTVYASGDSQTRAKLISCRRNALRLDSGKQDEIAAHVFLMERIIADAHHYDVIHFHTDLLHFPILSRIPVPVVTTMHGRLDSEDTHQVFETFSEVNLISISDAQRPSRARMSWQGTIHHGMPLHSLRFSPRSEGYLAFLGRLSPEKGVDRAIEIACKAGKRLKVAAKLAPSDRAYFQTIAHYFENPMVEFIGEISDQQKSAFLGGADALVFPIDWPEPFGLVMIEALATGTPVIAYPKGSVPEIIRHGQNGFLANSVAEAAEAVGRISEISRESCRKDFETRFSAERMAKEYLRIYRQAQERKSPCPIALL